MEIGVQAERTLLSWRRTALSLAALAALDVKAVGSTPTTFAVAAVLVVLGAGFVAVHDRRLRRRAGHELVSEPPAVLSVLALAAGCVLVAALAVVGVVLAP